MLQAYERQAPEFWLCIDYDYVFNLGPYVALILKNMFTQKARPFKNSYWVLNPKIGFYIFLTLYSCQGQIILPKVFFIFIYYFHNKSNE